MQDKSDEFAEAYHTKTQQAAGPRRTPGGRRLAAFPSAGGRSGGPDAHHRHPRSCLPNTTLQPVPAELSVPRPWGAQELAGPPPPAAIASPPSPLMPEAAPSVEPVSPSSSHPSSPRSLPQLSPELHRQPDLEERLRPLGLEGMQTMRLSPPPLPATTACLRPPWRWQPSPPPSPSLPSPPPFFPSCTSAGRSKAQR